LQKRPIILRSLLIIATPYLYAEGHEHSSTVHRHLLFTMSFLYVSFECLFSSTWVSFHLHKSPVCICMQRATSTTAQCTRIFCLFSFVHVCLYDVLYCVIFYYFVCTAVHRYLSFISYCIYPVCIMSRTVSYCI